MIASELRALGMAVWGQNWQSPLARALGVNTRTVRRWASGETVIPESVDAEIRRVIGASEAAKPEWPRDEWIVGDGPDPPGGKREYIIHTTLPRFIARVVAVDETGLPEPHEEPADVLSGVCYSSGDAMLCEIVWIDPPPPEREILSLMDAAADALEG